MIYGYARVSTAGQSKDGNSLEDQTKALQAYLWWGIVLFFQLIVADVSADYFLDTAPCKLRKQKTPLYIPDK